MFAAINVLELLFCSYSYKLTVPVIQQSFLTAAALPIIAIANIFSSLSHCQKTNDLVQYSLHRYSGYRFEIGGEDEFKNA